MKIIEPIYNCILKKSVNLGPSASQTNQSIENDLQMLFEDENSDEKDGNFNKVFNFYTCVFALKFLEINYSICYYLKKYFCKPGCSIKNIC